MPAQCKVYTDGGSPNRKSVVLKFQLARLEPVKHRAQTK